MIHRLAGHGLMEHGLTRMGKAEQNQRLFRRGAYSPSWASSRVWPPFLESLFDALDLLLSNEKKYVLVLDDLHYLRDGAVLRALPLLRKRLPAGFTVCLQIGRAHV